MNNMFRRLLLIILCISMSLSLVSCGGGFVIFQNNDTKIEEKTEEKAKWSIYIYMVGSNLEDRGLNELSKLTSTIIEEEATKEENNYNAMVANRIKTFTEEVTSMGLTLPNALYNVSNIEEEKSVNTNVNARGYATYSIDLINSCTIPDGVQIIIQTGGARRWQTSLVNPNRSQRFLVDKNGWTEIYNEPVANMANPDTLEDFMVFCKEYYPAENEMMLFWDHGCSYGGFGVDYIYGTDMLTVREMESVFENVSNLFQTTKDDKLFDIIAFDACVMGNLETMMHFRNYADYYLASAEELSGLGWGYDQILKALANEPDMTPLALGKVCVHANVQNVQLEDYEGVYPATFSLFDLSKVEALYDAYSLFAKNALIRSLADTQVLTDISAAASNTLGYCYGSSGGFNLYDLGLFAGNIKELFPEEAEKIENAIKQCVIYLESTTYFRGNSGISIYFPAKVTGLISLRKYLSYSCELSDNPDIDALYYYKITGCLNEKLRNYVELQGYGDVRFLDFSVLNNITSKECNLTDDGNFSVQLSSDEIELIQNVSFGLIRVYQKTGDVEYYNELDKCVINEDGTVSTNFDLQWPSLNGYELAVESIGDDETRTTYRVLVDYKDSDCYLLFYYDKATKEYTIAGITLSSDNGTGIAEREVMEIEEGEEISFLYKAGNLDEADIKTVSFQVNYSKDLKIVNKALTDGIYFEYISFEDLRSDVYYSPIVAFKVEDGVVVEQYVDYNISAFNKTDKS